MNKHILLVRLPPINDRRISPYRPLVLQRNERRLLYLETGRRAARVRFFEARLRRHGSSFHQHRLPNENRILLKSAQALGLVSARADAFVVGRKVEVIADTRLIERCEFES